MGRKSSSLLLLTVLLIFSFSLANLNPVYAKESKLTQAVYITLSQACGCMLDRCQAGDWVVDKVFTGDKKGLLKRIDFSTEKNLAKEYISKYRLAIPPSLLFLDKDGNLLWRADGELDLDLVAQKLKEFGA
jgi:hypothetical protein